MLQIVTKMYFRPGVEFHSTVHREVLYTNRLLIGREPILLPVGELTPSTNIGDLISSAQAAVTEHLEAVQPDGTPEVRIATGGTELIDDLADVLSFALNSIFSQDRDLVRRLIPPDPKNLRRDAPAGMFRETLDPGRVLRDEELDALREFMTELLALERSSFEAAMRAIRRIVRAMQRGAEDPTIAYTDLVVALESLAKADNDPPAPRWEDFPPERRLPIDEALADVEIEAAEQVREAILDGERLKLTQRFVQFTLNQVSDEFFRDEAKDALRPITRLDLGPALQAAYGVRSRNVHSLVDLPPEVWALGDRADTVKPPGQRVLLSLEGLARLARHVVRNFVARAPAGIQDDFNWRAALPGQLTMSLAPQYWIHQPDGFSHTSVERYFGGFVDHMLDVFAGREEAATDMRGVLEKIESDAPGLSENPAKAQMIAIYVLWHSALVPEAHRPDADKFIAKHEQVLEAPSLPAFVVGVMTDKDPDWATEEWVQLAEERTEARRRSSFASLPAQFDVALQTFAAQALFESNRTDDAMVFVKRAVEELPGNEQLLAWEKELGKDTSAVLDLRELLFGRAVEPDSANAS